MALVAIGKISLGDVNQEFGFARATPISLILRDNSGTKQTYINNGWVNLNPCSTSQPNVIAPHSISEWWKYNHTEQCNTTLPSCVSITNFVYTINGNIDWNNFILDGVQDINIAFNSYSPSGYGTPLSYEYILDTISTGIISNSTKNYPSLNVGTHSLTIKVYNCGGVAVTKNINFTVNAATTTPPTTTPPTTIPPTTIPPTTEVGCIGVTELFYDINGMSNPTSITGTYGDLITVDITGYLPSNATNPIEYEITLNGNTTGVGSNTHFQNFLNFPAGVYTLYIKIYNCSRHISVTKEIPVTVNAATTQAPTTLPPTTPPSCLAVTNFDYIVNGQTNVSNPTINTSTIVFTIPTIYPDNNDVKYRYEYFKNGQDFGSGLTSSNTYTFYDMSVGTHYFNIIVEKCGSTPTLSTIVKYIAVTVTSPCYPITDFNVNIDGTINPNNLVYPYGVTADIYFQDYTVSGNTGYVDYQIDVWKNVDGVESLIYTEQKSTQSFAYTFTNYQTSHIFCYVRNCNSEYFQLKRVNITII